MRGRYIILIWILVAAAGIGRGILTRRSFFDDLDQTPFLAAEQERIIEIEDINACFQDERAVDIDSLLALCDVCIKARVENQSRKYNSDLTITTVEVLSCYKGDADKSIEIVEPIYAVPERGTDAICTVLGYRWMEDGKDYTLFLWKLKNVGLGNSRVVFLPCTATVSKYCLEENYEDHPSEIYKKIKKEVLAVFQ